MQETTFAVVFPDLSLYGGSVDTKQIVGILEEIATLLEIKGENPFKIRAYQNAARALEQLEEPLEELIREDRLESVPGLGKATAEKVATLAREGTLLFHLKLRASVPAGLLEMVEIPGLGGKRIQKIHAALGVETVAALEEACRSGALAGIPGFGAKTAENILHNLARREAYQARHRWWKADQRAGPILRGLRGLPGVQAAEAAGSLRRYGETVGDLDFIVASQTPDPVMDWFSNQPEIEAVIARGETKCSIRFTDGLQADLRVVPQRQFPFALHHFTGSKAHNVQMRQRALARGFSLSEWGLTPVPPEDRKARIVELEGNPDQIDSEATLFRTLGLNWIPPEMREGRQEIALAEKQTFADLVSLEDIRGAFHNHTRASDGDATLEEMAQAAEALGWSYLGIADHSKSSRQANGLDEARLEAQGEEIRALNESGRFSVHIFSGVECDILADGRLDFEDGVLSRLDYVVASVHSGLSQDEDTLTRRLIRALEHPAVTMLGHPSGRLLLRREAGAVNFDKLLDAAAANGKMIELNCNPYRLDMDWRHWRKAADLGILCPINPDAHAVEDLAYLRLGVGIVRKAGLTAGEVFNTQSLDQVKRVLQRLR